MASVKRRPDGKWRARYRSPDGREHARHFDRKVDAEQWLVSVEHRKLTGEYVDPNAGRVTVEAYRCQGRPMAARLTHVSGGLAFDPRQQVGPRVQESAADLAGSRSHALRAPRVERVDRRTRDLGGLADREEGLIHRLLSSRVTTRLLLAVTATYRQLWTAVNPGGRFAAMENEATRTTRAVGANVRRLRTEREMTLEQLAELVEARGVTMSLFTLSKTERGLRTVSVDELVALAAALEVPAAELLTDPRIVVEAALLGALVELQESFAANAAAAAAAAAASQRVADAFSGLAALVRDHPDLVEALRGHLNDRQMELVLEMAGELS